MKFCLNYDKNFTPMAVVLDEFKNSVKNAEKKPFKICIERNGGYNYCYRVDIYASDDIRLKERNYEVIERLIKSLLWIVGGYKIYVFGDDYVSSLIYRDYLPNGKRAFDREFMSNVYEQPFEVIVANDDSFFVSKENALTFGGRFDGYRIGFDAGGSDRKVSAVVNGKIIYGEETVWNPKQNADYKYHVNGIKQSLLNAISKMPKVDSIGVSTAGVCIDNKIMVSSLFLKVPKEDFEKHLKNVYVDLAKEFGVPISVLNDGDVTALAGALELNDGGVLGIAMGTSEAGGYVDLNGALRGWLNELAFVPIDFNKQSAVDEWSKDYGCGVKYLSQDGVIKLAESAGLIFEPNYTPAEKLKFIQSLLEQGDKRVIYVYEDIGVYLGYAVAYYSEFYFIKRLLVLGRVTSGVGGEIIINKAKEVLAKEYPTLDIKISMPDESGRRMGQSVVASSLVGEKQSL